MKTKYKLTLKAKIENILDQVYFTVGVLAIMAGSLFVVFAMAALWGK